jgi:hypothetical protein
MRWAGKVARMRDEKCGKKFWPENLKERNYSEDLDVEGKIILGWILGK